MTSNTHQPIYMIDTIAYSTSRPLSGPMVNALNATGCYRDSGHEGWYISTSTKPSADGLSPKRCFTAIHRIHQIRLQGEDNEITRVSCSLSHVYHGHNAIQIKPQELDAALRRLDEILDGISSPATTTRTYTRVDLCLNICGDPTELLPMLRLARHPLIRRETETYSNPGAYQCDALNTVRLAGKEVVIQFYNKCAQFRGEHHNIIPGNDKFLRVEIQLKTAERIRRVFEVAEGGHFVPDYVTAYRTFRRIMTGIRTQACDAGRCSLIPLLALCTNQNVCLPNGVAVLEWYRQHVAADTYLRARREVLQYQFALRQFNWAEVLPEEGPPVTVDLHGDGRTELVLPPFTITPGPAADAERPAARS